LGGSGDCQYADCVADLKGNCPTELRIMDSGSTVACKSACSAFNAPEFCCTADHATPQTCFPTQYSEMFNNECRTAYSYACDDASSTCTCTGSDYLIIFCPDGSGWFSINYFLKNIILLIDLIFLVWSLGHVD
jgi:hypothetical protein